MKHFAFLLLLAASLPLQAAPPQLLVSTVDQDVKRVQDQLRQIQAQQASRESRNQQMRALIDREIAVTQQKMALQDVLTKQASNSRAANMMQARQTASERAAAQSDASYKAAADNRKAARDNLQKFLDILHSMNPDI
jgi:hypothetical protein